jgi:hypothetical protein
MRKPNTTRRGLIGSGAAMLLLAPVAEAGAADDAELLAACREFEHAMDRLDYLTAHSPRAAYNDPRTIAYEAEGALARDFAEDEAMEAVAAQPARTPAGLAAKAKCLRRGRSLFDHEESHLTDSLLADLIGRA